MTMHSIAVQGKQADGFTPLHSELGERRVIKCNHESFSAPVLIEVCAESTESEYLPYLSG